MDLVVLHRQVMHADQLGCVKAPSKRSLAEVTRVENAGLQSNTFM